MTSTGYLPSGQAAPVGTFALHRELPGGGRYDLTAASPGVTTLGLRDHDNDAALVSLDRAGVRRLIEDLTLVAGLAPTGAVMGRAAALAGAMRRNFKLLRELKRTSPAEADAIVAIAVADLRSWDPVSLLTAQVAP